MDFITAMAASKSLLELGQEIAKVVKEAQGSPNVPKRILLYLEAARAAVNTLGMERQRFLTKVRKTDVGDPDQLNALWERLDQYLHEDNIRPQLENSICGLGECRKAIKGEAKGAWWRKRDKEAASRSFSNTLNKLNSLLKGLKSNFYPGGTGMGVQTLVPIFKLISKARKDVRQRQFQNKELDLVHEKLGKLASQALRDKSHEDWFRMAGKVEALVAELQLAFSVKITGANYDQPMN